ncbi:MAG: segregation/condensation protein A, partial [Boseongicola sp. SB0675_bin_26]|nr:segregation/condensation protein A [Boseongicola sp. SB0675_bin_26]
MPDGDADFVEVEARVEPDALFVDVDGFEGPLDLLLQ